MDKHQRVLADIFKKKANILWSDIEETDRGAVASMRWFLLETGVEPAQKG